MISVLDALFPRADYDSCSLAGSEHICADAAGQRAIDRLLCEEHGRAQWISSGESKTARRRGFAVGMKAKTIAEYQPRSGRLHRPSA
jgi:hypothetical protein